MLQSRPKSTFFSIRDGLFMPFVYKGQQVVLHQSSWSFRESIWVNDDLVNEGGGYDLLFSGMGYRMRSHRVIEVAGDSLELTYGMRHWATEFFLEVRKDGELVFEDALRPSTRLNGPAKWLTVLAFTFGGMVLGYVVATLLL